MQAQLSPLFYLLPQPLDLKSKIEDCLLAPSKIKDSEVLQVASHIFGHPFASVNELREFVELSPSEVVKLESPSEDLEQQLSYVTTNLGDGYQYTHNVAVEEPPGYPLLFFLQRCCPRYVACHIKPTLKE